MERSSSSTAPPTGDPIARCSSWSCRAVFPICAKAGLGLAAISYDPVPTLADFAARRGITFPLLSDAGSETIKAQYFHSAALKDVTTLTITGTFEYQACDDKVCFAPQSVPLSWSIGVKPLDRERVKRQ